MENNLLKRIVGMACLLLLLAAPAKAQFTYGTTGLLHMPTADMQRDKTFMVGGSVLNEHATPARFNFNTYKKFGYCLYLLYIMKSAFHPQEAPRTRCSCRNQVQVSS